MKCLSAAGLLLTEDGAEVDAAAPPARAALYAGRYRYRAIRCNKSNCRACPHGSYAYRVWRAEGRQRERYLGPVDAMDNARAAAVGDSEYTRPALRGARASFGTAALTAARKRTRWQRARRLVP